MHISWVLEEIQVAIELFWEFSKRSKRYTGVIRGPEEFEADAKVFEDCRTKLSLKIMLRVIEEIQDAVKEIEEFQ
jgi:hypothetical protein